MPVVFLAESMMKWTKLEFETENDDKFHGGSVEFVVFVINKTVRKQKILFPSTVSTGSRQGVTKKFEYKMRLVYAHFPINTNIVNGGKVRVEKLCCCYFGS